MTQDRPATAQRGDASYTWDDTIAAIGQDFASGEEHVADEAIDYTAVERFCEPWEISNPIHWDKKVAKQAGYRGIVVPWSAIKQTFTYRGAWRPGDATRFPTTMNKDATARLGSFSPAGRPVPKPPTSTGIVTDIDIEFFEPVCVGDRLSVKGNKLVNVRPRATRIGEGAFMNRESEFYNQRGELVAKANSGGFSYNPAPRRPAQS